MWQKGTCRCDLEVGDDPGLSRGVPCSHRGPQTRKRKAGELGGEGGWEQGWTDAFASLDGGGGAARPMGAFRS